MDWLDEEIDREDRLEREGEAEEQRRRERDLRERLREGEMRRERQRRERLRRQEEIRRERGRRHQRLRRDAGRAEGRRREIRRGESRREDRVFSGRENRIGKFGAYKHIPWQLRTSVFFMIWYKRHSLKQSTKHLHISYKLIKP